MSGKNRDGSFVTKQSQQKETLFMWRRVKDKVSVECGEDCNLGLEMDQTTLNLQTSFIKRLQQLSYLVADQQPMDSDNEEEWRQSLRVKNIQLRSNFRDLRSLGASLRSELSDELVAEFKYNHFLVEGSEEEPALHFQQSAKEPAILWDIMYEGTNRGPVDWRQFWGFRVPITHWMTSKSRPADIRLRNGLFSAINEDLPFAGQEVELLAKRLQSNLPSNLLFRNWSHYNLSTALKEQVGQDLSELLDDEAEVESWWRACPERAKEWLLHFLDFYALDVPDPYREQEGKIWKEETLIRICEEGFRQDLIHLACHCEPSEESSFLSSLIFKVAGESLALRTADIAINMRRKNLSRKDPGPLVFLNACGTGQEVDVWEPPGFVEKSIRNLGALAVIVTLCPVPDYFAHAFAMQFYTFLLEGVTHPNHPTKARYRYVDEALLATRRYFMEQYNNPLGLAYQLYAVKGAQVDF